ncbi:hypothetical protein [Paenilisteria newyorkensis]|uniref:hypothetical protein n=1 Tax=Listeria newyorkensis TaxID=1497681 RepID=UPI000669DCBF|nr:hypothetical protein [Listeria newyorkensis]KMT58935.1 hypothetical protein X559_2941 [Listeria newyorkensis]
MLRCINDSASEVLEDIERNKKLVLLYEELICKAENNFELIDDLIRIGLSPEQASKASLIITGRIIKEMQDIEN